VPALRQRLRGEQLLHLRRERGHGEERNHFPVAAHRHLDREAVRTEIRRRQVEVADDRRLVAESRAVVALDREHGRQRRAVRDARIEELSPLEVGEDDGRILLFGDRGGEFVETGEIAAHEGARIAERAQHRLAPRHLVIEGERQRARRLAHARPIELALFAIQVADGERGHDQGRDQYRGHQQQKA
jgi:hypothetical protein